MRFWQGNDDAKFYSPLGLAIKSGDSDEVERLLVEPEVQASLIEWVPLSKTVLHAAVESVDQAMLSRVLAIPGINVMINWPDMHGDTALAIAAKTKKEKHVRLLLAHGASVDTVNIEGASPLDYAQHYPRILALMRIPVAVHAKNHMTLTQIKQGVIQLLHYQLDNDERIAKLGDVRTQFARVIAHVRESEDQVAIHRHLMALVQRQFSQNDGKGEPVSHPYLLESTISQLQYYGFLHHIPVTEMSARITQMTHALYGLFRFGYDKVPMETPSEPDECKPPI